jgi:SAM-dependent methyltransferase
MEGPAARPPGEVPDAGDLPPGVDVSRPSIARAYNYILGGKDHFEIDRRAAAALFEAVPETSQLAMDNRNHLRRAVQWLVREAGIRQIIDLGSGLPTVGNVHEFAQRVDPGVHVVYVDFDPLVLAHGRALLTDEITTTMIAADIRDPETVFADPRTNELIDLERPFAVIAASILHHLEDTAAHDVAARIGAQLRPGCYALISNFLNDDEPRAEELERAFLEGGLGIGRFRSWAEQHRFFDGLEMVEPGLVYANDWKPDHLTPAESRVHTLYAAGVARKPE